jgi:hypothetical protein
MLRQSESWAAQNQDGSETELYQQQTEARLAAYEGQAGAALEISPATRALLESRAADLERLGRNDSRYIIRALDPRIYWTLEE